MRKRTEGLSNADGAFRTGLNVSSPGDIRMRREILNLIHTNKLEDSSISGTRAASLKVVCDPLAETPAEFGEGPGSSPRDRLRPVPGKGKYDETRGSSGPHGPRDGSPCGR